MRLTNAEQAMWDGQAWRTCLPIALLMDYDIIAMYHQHASWRRAMLQEHCCSTAEGGETDACDN
jgi:hypothetical protein